ncbi:unnamed protein product, partial [Mesorhabditis spiculigera]
MPTPQCVIIIGTTSGTRIPEQMLVFPGAAYGNEGPGALSQFGRRQSVGLGMAVRAFAQKLAKDSTQAEALSGSSQAMQDTMQKVLETLYNNGTTPQASVNDQMLQIGAVQGCAAYDQAYGPIRDETLPAMAAQFQKDQALAQYVHQNTGWNCSLHSLTVLADNLKLINLSRSSYPDWINNCSLAGYTEDTLIAKILTYSDYQAKTCADYDPCRRLLAGVWLEHIVGLLDSVADSSAPKIVLYAAETAPVMSVMRLMGIQQASLEAASGFMLELRAQPASVRILTHEPLLIDGHVFKQVGLH